MRGCLSPQGLSWSEFVAVNLTRLPPLGVTHFGSGNFFPGRNPASPSLRTTPLGVSLLVPGIFFPGRKSAFPRSPSSQPWNFLRGNLVDGTKAPQITIYSRRTLNTIWNELELLECFPSFIPILYYISPSHTFIFLLLIIHNYSNVSN